MRKVAAKKPGGCMAAASLRASSASEPSKIVQFPTPESLWVAEDGTPLQSEVTGVVNLGDEVVEFRAMLQLGGLDDAENVIEPPI